MAKIRLASILEDSPVSDVGAPDEDPGSGGKKKVMVAVKGAPASTPSDPNYIGLKDSGNLKSGQFEKAHIVNLIKAAKATGVDPHQLLALDWQESNFGGSASERAESKAKQAKLANVKTEKGRTWSDRSKLNVGQITGVDNPDELAALSSKSGVESKYLAPALILRDKLKEAKRLGFTDPALQLQMYNGVGKLKMTPGSKYYGQSFPEGGVIDFRKTPLYGKRLLSLASDLKNNKDINDLISSN
jgi:hypothetical protein